MLKINDILKKLSKNKTNLYIVLVVGILILLVSNVFLKDNGSTKKIKTESESNIYDESTEILEKRLTDILSKINGAGKVQVMITYDTGKEKVTISDTKSTSSNTKDTSESAKSQNDTSNESNTVMDTSGGSSTPFVSKEINPKVRGVLVVADGASSKSVQTNMTNAVAALLDVPYHRIQVLPKSNK